MKHFTCDKCGMPMQMESRTRIDDKNYHICSVCHKGIVSGLEGKGEGIQVIPNNLDAYKEKFGWDRNKFLMKENSL